MATGGWGIILCEELTREKVNFVTIEGDPAVAEELAEKGFLVVHGDATEDEVLGQTGVTRAKGLVALVTKNVDNLYITLSARKMCRGVNDGLYILSTSLPSAATWS